MNLRHKWLWLSISNVMDSNILCLFLNCKPHKWALDSSFAWTHNMQLGIVKDTKKWPYKRIHFSYYKNK